MTKRIAVLFLLFAAACGGKSTPAKTEAPAVSRAPVAAGQVNRPVPGTYVYSLSALGAVAVPQGAQISETISASGDTFTSKVTNNKNPNYATIKRRWTTKAVELLETTTTLSTAQKSTCKFFPPVKIVVIPMAPQTLKTQQWLDPNCQGVTDVKIVDKETVKDANGKSWSVWKIEEKTQTKVLDTQIHFFSPDLGVDIRTQRHAPTGDTEVVLSSYPT